MIKRPTSSRNCGTPLAIRARMKHARTVPRRQPRVDREISDVDVFEHVIFGVRMNHILQILRDTEVLAASPPSVDYSASEDPDERPH